MVAGGWRSRISWALVTSSVCRRVPACVDVAGAVAGARRPIGAFAIATHGALEARSDKLYYFGVFIDEPIEARRLEPTSGSASAATHVVNCHDISAFKFTRLGVPQPVWEDQSGPHSLPAESLLVSAGAS